MHQRLEWLDFAILDHPLELIWWRILISEEKSESRALCYISVDFTCACNQWREQSVHLVDVARLLSSALAQKFQRADEPRPH